MSLFVTGLDATVLNVAVPTLSRELLPSGSQLLWIADSYVLTVAATLITCATLGDRLGRKRTLLLGFAVFGIASAGAVASAEAAQLIAARIVLGLGTAMIMSSTVAILRLVFDDKRERSVAIGLWTASNSVGAAVGPTLGGVLIERFGWQSVFLINVPIVVLALVSGALLIPESRNPIPGRWDATSALLSAGGLAAAVFALQRIGEHGAIDAATGSLGAIGVTLLVVFVRRQLRISEPLLDLSLFRAREFSIPVICVLVSYGWYMASLFLLTQRLQFLNGDTPLTAGLALMPLAVANAVGAALAPRLAGVLGDRGGLVGGLVMLGLALGVLATADGAAVPIALVCAGFGAGIVMTLASAAIMGAASTDRAGEAGAIQETAFSLGAGLGIGVLGSVTSLIYQATFVPGTTAAPAQFPTAQESIGAAMKAADTLGGAAGAALRENARHAFHVGFTVATAAAAIVAAALAIVTATLLRPAHKLHCITSEHDGSDRESTRAAAACGPRSPTLE